MKPVKYMNLGELAAYVCTYLNEMGIKCILTGGACVSIYTDNKYQSYDLDFIESVDTSRRDLKKLLGAIGFKEENRYFVHKDTEFFIEFPSGPLSAGSEPITDYEQLDFETGKLFLLKPTDCIKDRLAAFYHWKDIQALDQAIWVAEKHKIDINEVERWSKIENKLEVFNSIKNKLKYRK